MNYSEQQIRNIEEYAAIYLPAGDIAILIDVDPQELRDDLRDTSHPASIAYRRGKLKTKVTLHAQEVKLASVGSPLAIENARRNLIDMEDDE